MNYLLLGVIVLASSKIVYECYKKLKPLINAIKFTNSQNTSIDNYITAFKIIKDKLKDSYYKTLYKPYYKNNNKVMYIDFYYNMRWYSVPILLKKGPKPIILTCTSEKKLNDKIVYEDATQEIIKIAGPNVDFYESKITPHLLGMEKIHILTDEINVEYDKDEIINLN